LGLGGPIVYVGPALAAVWQELEMVGKKNIDE
jgi:hypothetical protein